MPRQHQILDTLFLLGLQFLVPTHAQIEPAIVANKPCPAGCTSHGNCNGETGLCECRFGFGGPDCSTRLLPACHSAPDLATSIPGYGHLFPKNCYCLRQLVNSACPRSTFQDPSQCPYFQFWDWKETRCYVLKTLAAQEEDPFQFVDFPPPEPYVLQNGDVLVGLERCPGRCSGRGWCVKKGVEDTYTCRCHGFYEGEACETPLNQHCYRNCSGRGTCSGGFCHCQPPYWGLGCTRSKAYVAETWLPHPTKLKIYVYDLPERVSYRKPWHDEPALLDTMYLAELLFMEQLLGDWSVRTENPWEANLFVLPTYTIYYTGNIGFPAKHFANVFNYVRSNYPFWNLTGGRNHVAFATNDRGCCDLYKLARSNPELQHPIKVVHFSQTSDPALEAAFREFKRLAVHQTSGGAEGEAMEEDGGGTVMQELPEALVRFRGFPPYTLEALRMEREPCFRPEQDVAVPNYLERGWIGRLQEAYAYDREGNAVHRDKQRPYLFYFNGYSKPDMAYSGGVRQGLLSMYHNLTRGDVAINPGCCTAEYMLQSRFCLCPLGYGWGIRLTQAMQSGCVPVIVQDHTYSAFWDLLPYEKFSVRINRHNLHRLFDLLDAVTPEQLKDLQKGLADYHSEKRVDTSEAVKSQALPLEVAWLLMVAMVPMRNHALAVELSQRGCGIVGNKACNIRASLLAPIGPLNPSHQDFLYVTYFYGNSDFT
ncbi:acetylglucosaminyltransferase [Volvox carteri f. nagariensis]|uniref:Acetylglucosaminyltransferase n=1 Tax=Volvox carteri f. nagariensis TaxID=3068 RepID=D8UFU9_VOLCA|nr:acetylglucosaminyltransferase [Volvox carteri f. nagariensis]EFJ41400.1 acetylglucosaminyltransferase [Volvox carteri f. nagariensis]|eukprot:XP_002957506.1 acetylglucosaminyltransferase [Volvox carteri f. nagariensis]